MSSLHFRRIVPLVTLLLTLLVTACSSGNGSSYTPRVPGAVTVTVVDGSNNPATPIAAAHILVFDTSTGNPVDTLTSNSSGTAGGAYFLDSVQLKVSAQGYTSSPVSGVQPLPVVLTPGQISNVTITLYPLDPALALGAVTGTVFNQTNTPVAGALVVADNGTDSITTTSDSNGNYILYNVPAGQVDITAWHSGYNFPTLSAITVADGQTVSNQDIVATGNATGSVSGHVSFTSISGSTIDITMLDPNTREIVPGLRAYTDGGGNYTINNVPNGTFEMIASLQNDGYVLDPDTSVTQGVPVVTVNNNAITKDFKVTGAIEVDTPAPILNYVVPVLSANPTFAWHQASSYSNLDYYIVEVVDESGSTICGGIDPTTLTGPVMIAKQDPISIIYSDYCSATLEPGRFYQLRIYARKPDSTTPSGYKLISATETLDGIFKVATP